MAKLTEAQWRALNWFADGYARSAYAARCNMGTLEALYKRGLLSKQYGLGDMAFPRTGIMWRITAAGRAILEDRDNG